MMNHDQATSGRDERGPATWRSVGALAAGWAARIEAQRDEAAQREERRFVPIAWAAE